MSDYLDPANEELLKDFFVEADLQVESLESNILVLETEPSNSDAVDEIFRAAHTLKGGAATVQMEELAEFTHRLEDTLDAIRGGNVTVGSDTVDTLLASIDVIKAMLERRQNGGVYDGDTSDIRASLAAILERSAPATTARGRVSADSAAPAPAPSRGAVARPADAASSLSEYELLELRQAAEVSGAIYRVTVTFREDNPMNSVGGIQVYALLKNLGQVLKTIPDFDELYEDRFYPEVIYFVASESDIGSDTERLMISDVTSNVDVVEIGPAKGGAAAGPQTESVAATPARTATLAPPVAEEPSVEPTGESHPETVAEARRAPGSSSILRVDSRRIDSLLNLVSETVITKAAFNQISNEFGDILSQLTAGDTRYRDMVRDLFDSLVEYFERAQQGASPKELRREISERFGEMTDAYDGFQTGLKGTVGKFRNNSQNLGRIAGELQEGVMRIRMVPISHIFSRFPRLVRDLSRSLNKAIDLVIEGEDTELDKSVIEDLLDPLIHCVRNSIDHGIEDVASRRAAGKPETGQVTLRASNEGNMILIEIADDGAGIDVEAVRRKAIERGVIHKNKQLSDIEAHNLIFDPGFSTAKTITNVSGRGVGLDVVKRQIDRLNGSVTVWSEPGHGTRFTIKIPLTLAIIQGLLVRVGPEMYAIPITSVIDSHRIRPSEIKMIDNYEVFNVREDVVSLLRLSRLFRIPTVEDPEYHYVVIVGTADRKMGLIVDSLVGEEDVVIKPLRDHFTNSPGIAGANITGDGRVSLIIDVSQLLELGLKREQEDRARRELTVGAR